MNLNLHLGNIFKKKKIWRQFFGKQVIILVLHKDQLVILSNDDVSDHEDDGDGNDDDDIECSGPRWTALLQGLQWGWWACFVMLQFKALVPRGNFIK